MRLHAPSPADLDAAPVGSRVTFGSPRYAWEKADAGWLMVYEDQPFGDPLDITKTPLAEVPAAYTLITNPVNYATWTSFRGDECHGWICADCLLAAGSEAPLEVEWFGLHYTDSAAAHDAGRQHTAVHVRSAA